MEFRTSANGHPKQGESLRSVLPITLPVATLRPVAFRTFTKKHDLTLTTSALHALAESIGQHCGASWRDHGLAEKVLEEVAKSWKKSSAAVIVEGATETFREILRSLESRIINGQLDSADLREGRNDTAIGQGSSQATPTLADHVQQDLGRLGNGESPNLDPRSWLVVVNAFDQPRLSYNPSKNQFYRLSKKMSVLPDPAAKTAFFRDQYMVVQQRLLRNLSLQTARPGRSTKGLLGNGLENSYKLTPIANLLGRGGTKHVLLGLLVLSPTGLLAISDLSGSVMIDLSRAMPIPADGAWFAPGMFAVVEGVYVEEGASGNLSGREGVGGTIGGKFLGLSIGGPPCERRESTLGLGQSDQNPGMWSEASGGGFGWVDFIGIGSDKAVGPRMRKLEKDMVKMRISDEHRAKIVVMGELVLDSPKTFQALRKLIETYAKAPTTAIPMAFVITGNFAQHAVMAGNERSSKAAYTNLFDSLASLLADFPTILRAARFIFVPGDKDIWESAFSGGAATLLPRRAIPGHFTAKIRKSFSMANAEVDAIPETEVGGDAVWTTNPARLSFLGTAQEIVIFRDDISGRIRRGSIQFEGAKDDSRSVDDPTGTGATLEIPNIGERTIDAKLSEASIDMPSHGTDNESSLAQNGLPSDVEASRKLVKTLLDQGHLSPFPLQRRPFYWDAAGALRLYPLPTALILVDPEAPTFGITYEGCHVMNPGRLVMNGRKNIAKWIEYDTLTRRSRIVEIAF